MSKNRSAINNFFRYYRPESETHELAIEQFCARRHYAVSIDNTPDARETVTYDLFREWFDMETPQCGEIVTLVEEGISGIIEMAGINRTVRLYISLKDGELNISPACFRYTSLRLASSSEALRLQRALHGHNLLWNRWYNRIKAREIPRENIQYQVSVLGRKVGYGVFREIDAQGHIVMYCMKLEGEPVRYSLHEVLGPASDYQLENINVAQREELAKELEQAGVFWNGFHKRIEPVNYLATPGKGYYYLNEFWEICKTIEQGKSKGAKYFTHGNYSRYKWPMEEIRHYLFEELKLGSVNRSEGAVYYYLKEFWKVCKTTDKGRSRDIKRAMCGNRFRTEEEALKITSLLRQKRNEQLAKYRLKKQRFV